MFKRVEKHLKRKQREDELGLDGEMIQILGLNDTDSDESGSDDNSNDDSSEGDLPEDEDNEDLEPHEADEESDSNTRKYEDERALITVSEALNHPVFIISLDPDIKECIICPGKLLKGAIMIGKHKSSNACTLSLPSNSYAQPTRLSPDQAHERRFKQFQRLAASATPNTKAQELVMKVTGERPQTSTPSSTSKRAEKKHIAQEKRKVKHKKFKTRQRNKKEALASNTITESKESKRSGKAVGGEQKEKEVAEGKKKGEAMERSKKADTSTSTSAPAESSTELVGAIKVKNKSPAEPPKKKQKTSSSAVPTTEFNPSTTMSDKPAKLKHTSSSTKPKSKPKPMSEPDDSPAVIQELQLQVKNIIKSAPSLAKAARARALNDDSDSNEKVPSIKKRKMKAQKL